MKDRSRSKGAKTPARSHHGDRVAELESLRVKRRKARWKANPPLAAAPPSLWEIRNALDAARTSLPAALRAGWLVHRLARTLCADFDADSEFRMPSVLDSLTDSRFNDETDEQEDLDLRPRYKTLMRHKRLWERFSRAAGLDPDRPPDPVFDESVPAPRGSPLAAARALLARARGTAAGLRAALAAREVNLRGSPSVSCTFPGGIS